VANAYWNDWYSGCGWFLWFHILNERYARGEITREEHGQMKSTIWGCGQLGIGSSTPGLT